MPNNYWTATHTTACQNYFDAANSTSTEEIRKDIVDKTLYEPLYTMAKTCLKTFDIENEDYTQDLVIHLVTKVLPKITEEKMPASLNYLWTASKNYTINYFLKKKPEVVEHSESYTYSISDEIDPDALDKCNEQRIKIIYNLNQKIRAQKMVNSTNAVFLLLLKQYILDHDFDVRGFGDYIRETMHLKLNTYRAIAGRLCIRTKELNEKLIGK